MWLDQRPRHPSEPQAQYCRTCAADLFDLGDDAIRKGAGEQVEVEHACDDSDCERFREWLSVQKADFEKRVRAVAASARERAGKNVHDDAFERGQATGLLAIAAGLEQALDGTEGRS
jgi:hypothetical protein